MHRPGKNQLDCSMILQQSCGTPPVWFVYKASSNPLLKKWIHVAVKNGWKEWTREWLTSSQLCNQGMAMIQQPSGLPIGEHSS